MYICYNAIHVQMFTAILAVFKLQHCTNQGMYVVIAAQISHVIIPKTMCLHMTMADRMVVSLYSISSCRSFFIVYL